MALKARITADEHGKLNDAIKAEYVKDEASGMFALSVTEVDGWTLDNPTNLRNAIKAERKRADDAEAKSKAFEGLDPSKARDALTQIEKLNAGELDDKAKRQIESHKRQLEEKHAAEVAPLKVQLAERDKLIDSLTIDRAIADASGAVQLIEGGRDLLAAQVKSKGMVRRVQGANGQPEVRVFGDDGVECVTKEPGKTGPMTVRELFTSELKRAYPGLYVVSDKSGSGADAGGSKRGTTNKTEGMSTLQELGAALSAA